MANYREGDSGRGMFGYEGEGFMRGGNDYDDFARGGYGRDSEGDFRSGFSGHYGTERGDRGWNLGPAPTQRPARESYRGRGPKNYQRSDERIREDVCERLTMDHDVDATEIEVAVAGGVVTLTGSVHERQAKRVAEEISESVRGVTDVQNNITVSR
jgi:hypothetical protein